MGTAALLAVTRRGAYVPPDGLAYLGTARNLADGRGYSPPPGSPVIGNFPPLFPLVLAGVGALGPDPATAARFAGPLLFGTTILVAGLVARRLTGSLRLAVAAQLLVLAGIDFLAYYSSALSEPLFIVLALLAVAALAPNLERRRPALLLAAAVLAGAACLTRYVGLAVVAAGAAALVLAGPGRGAFRRREHAGRGQDAGEPAPPERRGPPAWAGAAAFSMIALSPLVAWLAWANGEARPGAHRAAVWHPPGASYLVGGARTASTWVVPATVAWPARGVIAAAAVLGLGLVAWRSRHNAWASRLALLAGLSALAYLAALVVDRSLFDVTGRLDARFLLPVHLTAIALALWTLRAVDLRRSHLARIGVSAVVGLQLAAGAVWVRDAVADPEIRPGGFTAPSWERSEVIDQARAAPASAPLYTNEVDALWFHTGRVASPVPEKRAFLTGEPNPAYDRELAAMADGLRRGGLLVYFTRTPARRAFLPTPDELASTLGAQVVTRDGVGVAMRSAVRP